jgi:vancomycin resistance protein YoaR
MNTMKTVIVNGVSVKGIEISNLTMQEARTKLEEAFKIELNTSIKLETTDYETSLSTSQIEFEYNVSKAVEEAYSIGRQGNIFQNNYAILVTALFGKNIEPEYSYNTDTLDYIVDSVESKIPGIVEQASYYMEDNELVIIPGVDGISVNKEDFKEKILNTIKEENAIEILKNNSSITIEIPVQDTKADSIDIDKIYADVYTEPKDAYYEENPFKIYAEVDGVDFAISKDEAKKLVATTAEEYRIPLTITPASKTINDIGTEAFPYLISSFTTKYDASNTNRSQNLSIAAGKIDGTVLMPGEEFSFNQVVGKRTIEEGYKDAKIYQDGGVVDGLAGGICQISSTLYNAVVQANLEIVERRNHSFTTSYVPAGKDATVVYGVIDFKFKNTRTYPIKIEASVSSGIAGFYIHGIKEETEYDVQLAPVVTATIPYTTQYITDSTLASGQQVVVQSGTNGCKVTTYRETKLDGKLISKEIVSTDTYQPMKAIIRVGP